MGEINILIPVIAVGVALGGLILTSSRGLRQEITQAELRLRQEMTQMDGRLRQEMGHLRDDMTQMDARLRQEMGHLREDMTRLGERVARLEHGQARLEGLLEGLREAITGRTATG